MAKEISGVIVLNEVSTDGGATWRTIVCEDTSTITGSSASTEKKTKCGTFSTTSNNATTVSGSGVAVGDIDSGEISYQELQQLRDALTTVKFRRQNAASGTVGAGEITKASFDALITEVTETSSTEEAVSFTWAVTSTGVVDWGSES